MKILFSLFTLTIGSFALADCPHFEGLYHSENVKFSVVRTACQKINFGDGSGDLTLDGFAHPFGGVATRGWYKDNKLFVERAFDTIVQKMEVSQDASLNLVVKVDNYVDGKYSGTDNGVLYLDKKAP